MATRHSCAICLQSRRPVGKVVQEGRGWAVYRWFQPDSFVSGLATKGEAMKVLWALKHRWRSVTVQFMNGRTSQLDLTLTGGAA